MRSSNRRHFRRGILASALGCALSVPVLALAQAPSPPPRVHLTGIVGLVKPARVFLEVEQTGQSPRTLTLREGERDAAIELVSVDAARNRVRIRNMGVEQELSFAGSRSPTVSAVQTPRSLGSPPSIPAPPPPIVVEAQPPDSAPEQRPDITIVGRRPRVPIVSMLSPRTFGPGYGRFGDGVPVPPTAIPRPDAVAEPQPQQVPLAPRESILPPPQPVDPRPEMPTDVPTRAIRESMRQWQEALEAIRLNPPNPSPQFFLPPPAPPAPPAPAPSPAPTFHVPPVQPPLSPRTSGGFISAEFGLGSAVNLHLPPYFSEPGFRNQPPIPSRR